MTEVAVTVGPVTTPADYAERLKRIEKFARRLHIDISDGVFTPTKTINLEQIYDIPDVPSDLHLMVTRPGELVEMVISTGPNLVICHAEVAANWPELFSQWREVDIKVGLALKAETPVNSIKQHLPNIDHVLIFTGDHIGFNHSHFQPGTIEKVKQIKDINPQIEVSVDGGMSPDHTAQAVAAGADVIVTGGYVVDAPDPKAAFAEIVMAASKS